MKESKSPFKGFTVAEVFAAEASTYVIQVGLDLFCYKGQYSFTKRSAELLYNKILNNLVDLASNGTDAEKEDAMKCLLTLKVLPLRIN